MSNSEITLENYINDEFSICREERQYALFLNNILLKYRSPGERTDSAVQNIFAACGLPADAGILNVFYEATFMRDIFERNRRRVMSRKNNKRYNLEKLLKKRKLKEDDYEFLRDEKNSFENGESFNYKLIEYAKADITYNGKELNFSGNKELSDLRAMMNSKPDIAVIFEQGGTKYLHFLECKFDSSESPNGDKKQTEIQGEIAQFLCKEYFRELKTPSADDNGKEKYRSRLVQFTRDTKKAYNEIPITDLIRLNNEIFGIK